ncbi:MAG: AAA family ATPase [Chloroflexi bacterium]|nr:AAA family ATPase [Chloroflexota bacterium]
MPTLESITIKGFKSIRDVTVELRDINVLIGANGSGKSNFLEIFSFLRTIHASRLSEQLVDEALALRQYIARGGGASRLLHFGPKFTENVEIGIKFDRSAEYSILMDYTDADTLSINRISARYSLAPSNEMLSEDAPSVRKNIPGTGSLEILSHDDAFHRLLSSWRLYHFHDTSRSAPIKKTANLHDNRYLRADGSNLAAFLYLLREKHQDSYRFLRNTIRLVAPFFDDFILEPLALNPDTIRLEWKHVGTDAYFDVSSLSDGTLRFIALATLLQQPVELRPSVILLDEPELGLHPLAITMLASMVKSASVETQVILATQSPILLDHFEPEDVLVADREDGATKFPRLNSDDLAIWLKDYSIGELWEQNEFGGRPASERQIPGR